MVGQHVAATQTAAPQQHRVYKKRRNRYSEAAQDEYTQDLQAVEKVKYNNPCQQRQRHGNDFRIQCVDWYDNLPRKKERATEEQGGR